MKAKLLVLIATAMAVVGIGVLPALASAETAETFDRSDCPSHTFCLWSGQTYGGQQSFWPESTTGCHALENINPQSVWNNTNKYVELEGWGVIEPGVYTSRGNPFQGRMCFY